MNSVLPPVDQGGNREMTGARFQVKLYGHTSDDVEAFCKKLAALLMVSETEAMILLHEVPLVVRDNLTRLEAENLSDLLASIRALSIAEPMDGVIVEKKPQVSESTGLSTVGPISTIDDRADKQSKVWMFLGLGLVGFLIVSVIVGIMFSYVNLYSGPPAKVRRPSAKEDAAATKSPRIDENAIADAQRRVDDLKRDYEELRIERDEAYKDLSTADYRLANPGEMDLRRARLRSIQAKMKRVLEDLVDARLQLAAMKKRSSNKASK